MHPANVAPVKVLVVFYSRRGETEKIALAAGVGAIQGRAVIRLRRLADLADEETIARDPQWAAERERMNRDYIAPRAIDAAWADAILLASPAGNPAEMEQYLAGLPDLTGKIAAPLTPDGFPLAALERTGMTVAALTGLSPDPVAAARAHGKRVTEIARKMKA